MASGVNSSCRPVYLTMLRTLLDECGIKTNVRNINESAAQRLFQGNKRIQRFEKCTRLNLSQLGLKEIPPEFRRPFWHERIRVIDLSYNGLTALPPGLEHYVLLTEVVIDKPHDPQKAQGMIDTAEKIHPPVKIRWVLNASQQSGSERKEQKAPVQTPAKSDTCTIL